MQINKHQTSYLLLSTMAKAKLHFPAQSTASSTYLEHHKPLLLPQKSLENLSAHIQLSLTKVLLPRLCHKCRPLWQKKMELQELSAKRGSRRSGKGSKCQKSAGDKQAFTSECIIESICGKCRVAISGIDNTPKRMNQFDRKNKSCSTHKNMSTKEDNEGSMSIAQKFKSLFSRFVSYTPISSPVRSPSPSTSMNSDTETDDGNLYARLGKHNKNWCRFCGTTAGHKWYPGPWGPRTLCYRHSESCKTTDKLDLSCFLHEKERKEPVIRDYCRKCWNRLDVRSSCLRCYGCPFSYQVGCVPPNSRMINNHWFCSGACQANLEKLGINVNLPYQAIMPFSQVEVVSDMGEVPIIPCHVINRNSGEKRKISFEVEEEDKENNPKKHRSNSAPTVPAGYMRKVDIPVPGVIRHSMCAARRYSSVNPPAVSHSSKLRHEEAIDDQTYLNRHKRYETMELSSRICRPQILKRLLKKQS